MFQSIHPVTGGTDSVVVLAISEDFDLPSKFKSLKDTFSSWGFTGEKKQVVERHHEGALYLLFGMGGKKDPMDAFQTAGAIGRRLGALKCSEASLYGKGLDYAVVGAAFQVLCWDPKVCRGTVLGEDKRPSLTLNLKDDKSLEAFQKGMKLGEAINFSRTLSATPPNIATPDYMAAQAESVAKACGLECSVIRGKELEKERMTGLINVGKASIHPPCLIRLEYRPKGATGQPVVLVGKTITYDTGGLSIKPREGMVGMKQDKNGGCAVLGAMMAIATVMKPKTPVVALLCAAENSISEQAYRPDDVLTFRNGVTVEVTNTDAEGRLVLADGLIWACEKEKPACVVDIATLTGGVVTALGKVFAGGFTNNESAFKKIQAIGETVDERIWQLPLTSEYREMMESPVADIQNSNANRQAHPVQGAAFLSYFVPDDVPWIHLDIAGVSSCERDSGPFVKGPNGWGVSLLSTFASKF